MIQDTNTILKINVTTMITFKICICFCHWQRFVINYVHSILCKYQVFTLNLESSFKLYMNLDCCMIRSSEKPLRPQGLIMLPKESNSKILHVHVLLLFIPLIVII